MINAEQYLCTVFDMKDMNPIELNNYLISTSIEKIPESVSDLESLEQAGQLLGITMNRFTFLADALSYFKIWTKQAKKESKEAGDLMMLRRDCIQTACTKAEKQYTAVSRLISVKQELNKELRMGDGK